MNITKGNKIREIYWQGQRIQPANVDPGELEGEFVPGVTGNNNVKFKEFTDMVFNNISLSVKISPAELKKMIKPFKPKIPRKTKKKLRGTKRGRRRLELKKRDGRTIEYTDLHFAGQHRVARIISKMYHTAFGKAVYDHWLQEQMEESK